MFIYKCLYYFLFYFINKGEENRVKLKYADL